MARYVFKLPDIGEGTAEAEITAWHVEVGDIVDEDQPLVDVMTDKATLEIPSPVAGRIAARHGEAGEKRAVGSELVVFETDAGAPLAEPAGATPAKNPPPPHADDPCGGRTPDPSPAAGEAGQEGESASADRGGDLAHSLSPPRFEATLRLGPPLQGRDQSDRSPRRSSGDEKVTDREPARARPAGRLAAATRTPGERPIASPAVRRKAWEAGVELQFVPGTGPGGRILHDDLDAYLASGQGGPARPTGRARRDGVEEVRIIGLRRRIAERMQDTKRRIPHFSYIEEVDVTALEELRRSLNADGPADRPKLTLLPFLMRALAVALPGWPQVNARFDDEAGILRRSAPVHVGIATQTPGGLLVPVVRHAEALSLWEAAAEVGRLARAARDGKASAEELTGSTITITSLGPLGGLATTPVINAPEVAIVGVNKIVERPMVRDGAIAIRKMMNLSSSFDHRIVDGWDAAEFVQRLRVLLEQPARLFLDEAQ